MHTTNNKKCCIYPPNSSSWKWTGPVLSLNTVHCFDFIKYNGIFYGYVDGTLYGQFSDSIYIEHARILNPNNDYEKGSYDLIEVSVFDTPLISGNYTPDYTTYFMEKEYNLFPLYTNNENSYGKEW